MDMNYEQQKRMIDNRSWRLSKRAIDNRSWRLSKRETDNRAWRLSKREALRVSLNNLDIPNNLLNLTQRSLRLSRRVPEKFNSSKRSRSWRLSKRSDDPNTIPIMNHQMVIRLSKRQMENLLAFKRETSSILKQDEKS